MKIPTNAVDRVKFYQELTRQCLASREQRYEFYKMLRNYYLFGSATSDGAIYNKIASTIETECSFIYAPDSTKFNIHLGTTAPIEDLPKVRPLVAEINDLWRMSKAHINFGLGLKWSLVFGCMLFKTLWMKGLPRPYLVEPHQFGVLREDLPELADQEAFVHCYTTTKTQLQSELAALPKDTVTPEREKEIFARVGRGGGEGEAPFAEGMSRLILSAGVSLTAGTSSGGGALIGGMQGGERVTYEYAPNIEADLIDMFELYVWNDDDRDYQMVTIAAPDVVIYDRRQPGVKGVPCFEKLAPELNLYDYFWGESFVAKVSKLQDWRTARVLEIRNLLARQADPPISTSGFAGIAEEKMAALRRSGGLVSSNMPGAKVDVHAPTMPPNTFTELSEIDRMFDDQAGIGHILQGKGEPGVRSKGQADLMARLGSARPKQRAMVVEEAAEGIATLMLRLHQINSEQRFSIPDEKKPDASPLLFTSAQFTTDYEVRVDAHSSSPIFVEDRKHDAMTLLEAKAIDRETLLEVFDPPGLQTLKSKLKDIQQREAEAAAREMAAQQAKETKP